MVTVCVHVTPAVRLRISDFYHIDVYVFGMDLKRKFSVLPPVITCHYTPACLSVTLRSVMLRAVGWWLFTDFSGQPIGPISRGQVIKFSWSAWPLKMGPLGRPEMSVNQQPTPRNITEEQRHRLTLFITKSSCIK